MKLNILSNRSPSIRKTIPSQSFPVPSARDTILDQHQYMLPEDKMVKFDQNDDMVEMKAI
jgi:hypothetical protein